MEAVPSSVTKENGHRGGASWRGGSLWGASKDVYRSAGQWRRLGLCESQSRLMSEFSGGTLPGSQERSSVCSSEGAVRRHPWPCPVGFLSSEGPTPRGQAHSRKGPCEGSPWRGLISDTWKAQKYMQPQTTWSKGRGGRAGLALFRYLTNCYLGACKEKKSNKKVF